MTAPGPPDSPPGPLALGLDIGGTATRALVVDAAGARLGAGRAGGANLNAHTQTQALDEISTALRAALDGVEASQIGHAVIGSAGHRNLGQPDVVDAFGQRWREAGLTCDYDVVPDALVAFVAGTPDDAGTLLLSGTGALAARVEERRLVHIADGHGWLLGDLGSGFWIGRQAVRATLAAIDRRSAPGPLGEAVTQTLLGPVEPGAVTPRETADQLIIKVHAKPPVALAALAPLVTGHAGRDPDADRILDDAAHHLMRTVSAVRPPAQRAPLVLAGSLLSPGAVLTRLITPLLTATWPGAVIRHATDGVAGAAWMAAVRAGKLDAEAAASLHESIFGS